MARKPQQRGDREPITIRAAKIGAKISGRYTVIAAVVGAVVAALLGVGLAHLMANGHGSTTAGIYYSIDVTGACEIQHHDPSLRSVYEKLERPQLLGLCQRFWCSCGHS